MIGVETVYMKVKNMVLWASSEISGFASKDDERFWSTGVLECWKKLKPEFQLDKSLSLLHYSITPRLQQTFA
jgi:hypothetical protein